MKKIVDITFKSWTDENNRVITEIKREGESIPVDSLTIQERKIITKELNMKTLYTNQSGVETMQQDTHTFYAWEQGSQEYERIERNIEQNNIAILIPIKNATPHSKQQGVYQCKGGRLA